MRVYDIDTPEKIKGYSIIELTDLAEDIRALMIREVSKNGGRLAKNLSVVELTLALHSVFDVPNDKLIFDGGDCCYAHKMLTGRSTRFSNLRKFEGISDYQKRAESLYDVYEATNFSACSAALGFSISRDILKEDYDVIAYIDSDSLKNGKTMEALMDIGKQNRNVIIVYNETESNKHTSLFDVDHTLTQIRTSSLYQNIKGGIKKSVGSKVIKDTLIKVKDSIKEGMVDAPLFKGFNLDYMGPINGHDLKDLIKSFKACQNHRGPILVHVVTKYGYGYDYIKDDSHGKWNCVAPFNMETGQSLLKTNKYQATFQQIMDHALTDLKSMDPRILKIDTATYVESEFKENNPESYIHMPNAYNHAISVGCGSAIASLHPYVSIPSCYINDTFHSLCMEMAKMKCGMVVGIEDCGLINQDKEHGIYDVGSLKTIPNLVVCEPRNDEEAQHLLYSSFLQEKPTCIRLASGLWKYTRLNQYKKIEIGSWEMEQVGMNPTCIVICYGPNVDRIIHKAKENDVDLIVVNARFIKPMDYKMLDTLLSYNLPIYVFEISSVIGGIQKDISDYLNICIKGFGIDDHFVKEGPIRTLRIEENVHLEALFKEIEYENSSR